MAKTDNKKASRKRNGVPTGIHNADRASMLAGDGNLLHMTRISKMLRRWKATLGSFPNLARE